MSRSVSELTCWAERRLREAGIDEARLEARLLVGHLLGVNSAGWIARETDPAPAGLATRLNRLLKRRTAREPMAHILGETEFYGLPFKTDRRALIPRADSETVVELALDVLPDGARTLTDFGTGTGCLLLTLLHNAPTLNGTGLDASADAVALAQENAAALGLGERATFVETRWADWYGWRAVDLIISNPPYIATHILGTLQAEVKDHDPRLALDGGADGLAAYREIIALGQARMKPGAWLVLEIGFDQQAKVTDLLVQHGFTDLQHRRDLGGNDRAIAARLAAH
ncbi:MAG: peptide chain release factor N(5)-glutamine methyltransferase [Pseudomonadota bacterium]